MIAVNLPMAAEAVRTTREVVVAVEAEMRELSSKWESLNERLSEARDAHSKARERFLALAGAEPSPFI